VLDKALFSPFVEVILNILSKPRFQVAAGRKLRKGAKRCQSMVDYVNLAFSFYLLHGALRSRPTDVKGEIAALMRISIESRPRLIVADKRTGISIDPCRAGICIVASSSVEKTRAKMPLD